MYAKILTKIPTLGDTPEIHFGDHFQYSLWIEFMDHINEKWYGCFSSFYPTDILQSFNNVLVDQDNNSAFVKELTHNILFTNQISTKVIGNHTAPEIYHDTPINFELDLITFEIITLTP